MHFCNNCGAEFDRPLNGRCPACGASRRHYERLDMEQPYADDGGISYGPAPTDARRSRPSPSRPARLAVIAGLLTLLSGGLVFFLVMQNETSITELNDETYADIWLETYEDWNGGSTAAWDEALAEYGTSAAEFDDYTRELLDDGARYQPIAAEIAEDLSANLTYNGYVISLATANLFDELEGESDADPPRFGADLEEFTGDIARQIEAILEQTTEHLEDLPFTQ
jgi:predicted  nucleic acid-binding Zn-ribbon protein